MDRVVPDFKMGSTPTSICISIHNYIQQVFSSSFVIANGAIFYKQDNDFPERILNISRDGLREIQNRSGDKLLPVQEVACKSHSALLPSCDGRRDSV